MVLRNRKRQSHAKPENRKVWTIGGIQLKECEHYKYLGVYVKSNGKFSIHFACKYALGVKASRNTEAVYEELGRVSVKSRLHINIVKFYNRLINLGPVYMRRASPPDQAGSPRRHLRKQLLPLFKRFSFI